ncbi:hypothetical protein CONLIGDRAFT_649831 [Coniochaeta ligniaria NRRL 30616]|uniref:Uncharacterized protein n=1 Tax=Coniochaeta ligniaria NRRL 30616 TaxID=1408157 RepID=A0A1J7J0B3_9PEZI|nr:hypothetical protein CONLIGDRAFT_649831 [Coniochaeta ligniaria NRRL 30616]
MTYGIRSFHTRNLQTQHKPQPPVPTPIANLQYTPTLPHTSQNYPQHPPVLSPSPNAPPIHPSNHIPPHPLLNVLPPLHPPQTDPQSRHPIPPPSPSPARPVSRSSTPSPAYSSTHPPWHSNGLPSPPAGPSEIPNATSASCFSSSSRASTPRSIRAAGLRFDRRPVYVECAGRVVYISAPLVGGSRGRAAGGVAGETRAGNAAGNNGQAEGDMTPPIGNSRPDNKEMDQTPATDDSDAAQSTNQLDNESSGQH